MHTARRFREELLCEECAEVAATTRQSPKPVSTVAKRAAAINTAAIAEKRLVLGALLSLLSAGGVLVGAILIGHLTKDTWELDNAPQIRSLADEASQLDRNNTRAALEKYTELANLVGDREIRDEELKQVVIAAQGRHQALDEQFAVQIAHELEEARQREEAEREATRLRQQEEQERQRRRAEAQAREEEQRREEAERLAAAEMLKRDAYLMSQEFIKKQLKAPSSARFPEYESNDVLISFDEQTEKYTVISWVEGQNAFGVYLRSPYVCRLWPTTGDRWRSDLAYLGEP